MVNLLLGLLAVKNLLRKRHRDGQFFTMEQPGVVAANFGVSFFDPLSEHFCAYLRFHSADYSDLGITGKIFSSCRS